MRFYAGILIGATLATPIAGALTYATVASATHETRERHAAGHAYERAVCWDMARASTRAIEKATRATWAQHGPTGIEMEAFITREGP